MIASGSSKLGSPVGSFNTFNLLFFNFYKVRSWRNVLDVVSAWYSGITLIWSACPMPQEIILLQNNETTRNSFIYTYWRVNQICKQYDHLRAYFWYLYVTGLFNRYLNFRSLYYIFWYVKLSPLRCSTNHLSTSSQFGYSFRSYFREKLFEVTTQPNMYARMLVKGQWMRFTTAAYLSPQDRFASRPFVCVLKELEH